MTFSEPRSDGQYTDGIRRWVSHCSLGGAVSGPSKADIQRQAAYWLAHQYEWENWIMRQPERNFPCQT